jgi:hypothetical protein
MFTQVEYILTLIFIKFILKYSLMLFVYLTFYTFSILVMKQIFKKHIHNKKSFCKYSLFYPKVQIYFYLTVLGSDLEIS